MMTLQACLNGTRPPSSHPALPLDARALALDARACAEAGATSVHLHPRDATGAETLDPAVVDATAKAVRDASGLPVGAVARAAAIDDALDRADIAAPRLHHGVEAATWAVLARAVALGHDIRVGLEDTLVLPGGRTAPDNAALVTAALHVDL